ncbi:hypothetical protein ASE36_16500 [Rhizobium sp. Root274]|nr:hypothetical protein ASC71_16535 [Rhizobium sp. Root1240]KRD28334.1 hypothetical protein ASE36_16500 [Rhizobium sp. Root274]
MNTRVIVAVAVLALIACWFWWQEEEKWCDGFYQDASPAAFTVCLPLSPFVAFGIVTTCCVVIIWMKLRKSSR